MAAATPRDIVTRLNREIGAVLAMPDLGALQRRRRGDRQVGTPEAFGTHIAAEFQKWGRVIREAGIKPQ